MKTVGLITEYNPFHNGHLYHLALARERAGADYVIVVMSGDFVQRGEPAIMDKYERALMALKGGADLVLELPCVYATGSAEYFASGAVSLLDRLGVVDALCFGCETDRLPVLGCIATLLAKEPEEFTTPLHAALKQGYSFPKARSVALAEALRGMGQSKRLITLCREAAETPNNILGIEYLKALIRLDSPILPVPVKRIVTGHRDEALPPRSHICSAAAIRKLLHEYDDASSAAAIKDYVPDFVYAQMEGSIGRTFPIYADDISLPLHCRLLAGDARSLVSHQDMTGALANKVKRELEDYTDFSSFVSALGSRDMTETRIKRTLLHVLLGIQKSDMDAFLSGGVTGYARVLGFRRSASPLLTRLREVSRVPLITKPAAAEPVLDPLFLKMLKMDMDASHLYSALVTDQYRTKRKSEYRRPLVVL